MNEIQQPAIDRIATILSRNPDVIVHRHEENADMQHQAKQHRHRPDEIQPVVSFLFVHFNSVPGFRSILGSREPFGSGNPWHPSLLPFP